jgi:hypothetical protein
VTDSSPLIRLTSMFEKTSKDGTTYYVGVAGGVKLLLLKNKHAGENEPGWNLCVTARPEKTAQQARAPWSAPPPPRPQGPVDPDLDDDVPFLG